MVKSNSKKTDSGYNKRILKVRSRIEKENMELG